MKLFKGINRFPSIRNLFDRSFKRRQSEETQQLLEAPPQSQVKHEKEPTIDQLETHIDVSTIPGRYAVVPYRPTVSVKELTALRRNYAKEIASENATFSEFSRSSVKFLGNQMKAAISAVTKVAELSQNLIATNLASEINGFVHQLVQSAPTIYDKALDAVYIDTHIGGGLHRMFDGGHTLAGAWKAVQSAAEIHPESFAGEGILDRISGTVMALFKDGSTPNGLPLFTWDPETYSKVSGYLNEVLGIPRHWFAGLNSYTTAELLSGVIGAVVLMFRWNKAEAEEFARIAGGLATAGTVSANPLLLIVAIVAFARTFNLARKDGDYSAVIDGLAKGAIVSGATISAVALVGTVTASPGLGLLVGLVVGILAFKASQSIDIKEFSHFIIELTTTLTCGVGDNVKQYLRQLRKKPLVVSTIGPIKFARGFFKTGKI